MYLRTCSWDVLLLLVLLLLDVLLEAWLAVYHGCVSKRVFFQRISSCLHEYASGSELLMENVTPQRHEIQALQLREEQELSQLLALIAVDERESTA
ncbi:uncharacterized protein MEPE_04752 [Melanopsichium pennsylvanicum]|uniref:Uncharacterized protein n=1 Tax=Melanopsichium pennsylvanicum TaxID=63383 RepID=A0AAJ4XPP4_9BASI|nr:uncharacterized protein MEPE_04752 [Melanopsichium pennsylvanicum]